MNVSRRTFLKGLAALIGNTQVPQVAPATAFPAKPVQMPFSFEAIGLAKDLKKIANAFLDFDDVPYGDFTSKQSKRTPAEAEAKLAEKYKTFFPEIAAVAARQHDLKCRILKDNPASPEAISNALKEVTRISKDSYLNEMRQINRLCPANDPRLDTKKDFGPLRRQKIDLQHTFWRLESIPNNDDLRLPGIPGKKMSLDQAANWVEKVTKDADACGFLTPEYLAEKGRRMQTLANTLITIGESVHLTSDEIFAFTQTENNGLLGWDIDPYLYTLDDKKFFEHIARNIAAQANFDTGQLIRFISLKNNIPHPPVEEITRRIESIMQREYTSAFKAAFPDITDLPQPRMDINSVRAEAGQIEPSWKKEELQRRKILKEKWPGGKFFEGTGRDNFGGRGGRTGGNDIY